MDQPGSSPVPLGPLNSKRCHEVNTYPGLQQQQQVAAVAEAAAAAALVGAAAGMAAAAAPEEDPASPVTATVQSSSAAPDAEEEPAPADAVNRSFEAVRGGRRRSTLTLAELPKRVLDCQYAVRGPTVELARQLSLRLAEGHNDLPFKRLIYVNIGDPQALGQPPISFFRQVLACLMYPPLMGLSLHSNAFCRTASMEETSPQEPVSSEFSETTHESPTCCTFHSNPPARPSENHSNPPASPSGNRVGACGGGSLGNRPDCHSQNAEERGALDFCPSAFRVPFPEDVTKKAREYLASVGSVGAYSHSQGVRELREIIATWFGERDGVPASPDDLFLTDGASAAVARIIEVLYRGPEDGLLIPIPQYPLYAGLLTRIGATTVGYYLDEERGWALDVGEVESALKTARQKGINVRGIVIINPGNPTGQLIKEQQLKEVVQLCHRESLVLLADEVYQENVYGDSPFVSLRKIVMQQQVDVPLFSLHSSSKGLVGECGFRGGCVLIENVEDAVKQQLYKLSSMSLCSNLFGQLMMTNLCNPPRPGDPSYPSFIKEKESIYRTTRRKADTVYRHLNAVPGISCQRIEGSVFGFPRIELPKRAQDAAAAGMLAPDLFFCMELLKATGIVGVAGSGFGQREGTFHVRICILPDEALLTEMIQKFKTFYMKFIERYKD
ncbi:aminotransferase, putative [Eimeria tenella]|uniref:Aminotransferase, putative n=1 Tax=Eimeria tenella TaxID=5802 RepID=U6KUP2_EIMTE|nr:aminotransferase, putative [Eimeria tenella]CDJ41867.1 aminotransferase, putative [Eimeria tenella]|eukprot:XP_013232617.1 aminotransferase, putative [Eimeria tenella]